MHSTSIASVFMGSYIFRQFGHVCFFNILSNVILLIKSLTPTHKKEINVNRAIIQQFACSTRVEKINRKIISLEMDTWKFLVLQVMIS